MAQLKKIRDWIREEKPAKPRPVQRLMPATTPAEARIPCPACKTGRLFLSDKHRHPKFKP